MISNIKQSSKKTIIFMAVLFFFFFNGFVGSGTASEKPSSKICLPILEIKIDGQEQDWAAIKPQLMDLPGDSMVFTHTGVDILSCTVATNQRRDTLFVMVKVRGGPSFEYNLVQYVMGFDDPVMNSSNRVFSEWLSSEWLIGIDSYNKFWIWDLRGKNTVEDQSRRITWASSENKISKYAQDEVIEYSIPFSIFQGMEEFKIELFLKLRDRDKTRTDMVRSEMVFTQKICVE